MGTWTRPSERQVSRPAETADAERFRVGFSRGRAGAVGWPAKTNLVARSTWYERQTWLPVQLWLIQGQTIRQRPRVLAPTIPAKPMRQSDYLRIYESQLLHIQDYLIGAP